VKRGISEGTKKNIAQPNTGPIFERSSKQRSQNNAAARKKATNPKVPKHTQMRREKIIETHHPFSPTEIRKAIECLYSEEGGKSEVKKFKVKTLHESKAKVNTKEKTMRKEKTKKTRVRAKVRLASVQFHEPQSHIHRDSHISFFAQYSPRCRSITGG
jgi:hypothetical protein